jgi:hypothetical protein
MKTIINRTNITTHLVEYQLNMVGKTIFEVESDEFWYSNNTLTPEEHEQFKAYAIPLLKKVFKFNKKKAENTFSWFDMQFGLRINDEKL